MDLLARLMEVQNGLAALVAGPGCPPAATWGRKLAAHPAAAVAALLLLWTALHRAFSSCTQVRLLLLPDARVDAAGGRGAAPRRRSPARPRPAASRPHRPRPRSLPPLAGGVVRARRGRRVRRVRVAGGEPLPGHGPATEQAAAAPVPPRRRARGAARRRSQDAVPADAMSDAAAAQGAGHATAQPRFLARLVIFRLGPRVSTPFAALLAKEAFKQNDT